MKRLSEKVLAIIMNRTITIFSVVLCLVLLCICCQKAAEPYINISNEEGIVFTPIGGEKEIVLSANYNWTVSSDIPWCTVSPASGEGSERIMVAVSCLANDDTEPRSGSILFTCQTVQKKLSIRQEKKLVLSVTPLSYELTSNEQEIEVTINSNIQYSVSIPDNWIHLAQGKAITSNKVYFTVDQNDSYDEREGRIVLNCDSNELSTAIVIRQQCNPALSLSKKEYVASSDGESFTVNISHTIDYSYRLSSSNCNWVHVEKNDGTKALGNDELHISIDKTDSYYKRNVELWVTNNEYGIKDTLKIIQEALPPINLSEAGIANCYVVPPTNDMFSIDASVKGNGKNNGSISPSIEGGKTVKAIWQVSGEYNSVSDVLMDLIYDEGNKRILFIPNQQEGNALVALLDENDIILWSWHLWITNYDPNEDYVTFMNGTVLQDRNLGAFSDERFGLYYQWGRKDPFTSNRQSYYVIDTDKDSGSVQYSISHPNTFMRNNDNMTNWDWNFEHSSYWSSNKTIYDPCPAGWKVMDGNPFCLPAYPMDYTAEYLNNYLFLPEPFCTPSTKFIASGVLHTAGHVQSGNVSLWTNYGTISWFYVGGRMSVNEYDEKHSIYHDVATGRAYGFNVRCQRE